MRADIEWCLHLLLVGECVRRCTAAVRGGKDTSGRWAIVLAQKQTRIAASPSKPTYGKCTQVLCVHVLSCLSCVHRARLCWRLCCFWRVDPPGGMAHHLSRMAPNNMFKHSYVCMHACICSCSAHGCMCIPRHLCEWVSGSQGRSGFEAPRLIHTRTRERTQEHTHCLGK